jgi:hypothetical protein
MVVNETYSLRGSIIMYGMIMLEAPTMILMIVLWQTGYLGESGPYIVLSMIALMVLLLFLLINIRLELRIDDQGITYRNPPFINKWRKIRKGDILHIELKKLDGMFEYGGVGIKKSLRQTAYVYLTDHVIEIKLPKKKLVFSTEKPHEVKKMIMDWNQIEI